MNATPVNVNPANAVQVQPASAKPQDSAAQDVPFSQVLSSEIAQKRNSSEAKEDTEAKAPAEGASQAASPAQAGADSAARSTAKLTDGGKPAQDPRQDESPAATPDLLLALAIHPDMLKPAAASTDATLPEQAAALTRAPTAQDARNGRVPLALQAGQRADETTGKQETGTDRPGKADFRASVVAATAAGANATAPAAATAAAAANATANAAATAMAAATAVREQEAVRKSDALTTAEHLPDLMSAPAMRVSAHLAAPTLDQVAANQLAPSVGTTAWNQALGEKIVWMAAGAQQTASLTLNPPNMGPLQIVLNVSNDQATASFFSAQPEVRQALESAFPRLREMMNEAGIQLGQATVSADTPRQHDAPDRQAQWLPPAVAAAAENDMPAGLQGVHAPVQQSGRGLIDTFA